MQLPQDYETSPAFMCSYDNNLQLGLEFGSTRLQTHLSTLVIHLTAILTSAHKGSLTISSYH